MDHPFLPVCHWRKHVERATDREIDGLVVELYGLTDEEIATIEKTAAK